jgi:hypothetical protein
MASALHSTAGSGQPQQPAAGTYPLRDVDYALEHLQTMRERGIWPNGMRYLWTGASRRV